MARIVFALISLLCMFQTLAGAYSAPSNVACWIALTNAHLYAAPLHRRAVTSAPCSNANVGASEGILSAQLSLGAINTA